MSSKRPFGLPSGNTPGKPPQKSSRNLKASSTHSGSPRKSLVFHDNGATKVCIVFNMFTKHPCNLYSIVEIFTSTCMINFCAHNFLFQEKNNQQSNLESDRNVWLGAVHRTIF